MTRIVERVVEEVLELFHSASNELPGGSFGVLLILLLLAGLVALVVARLRPTLRSAHQEALFDLGRERTADEHRELADLAAARADWAEAVRERLRAVVRHLEERGVLDPRPGRTAEEVVAEAGRAVPALHEPLTRGTDAFEQIWYGGRPAGPEDDAVLRGVDQAVSATRLVPA